MTARQIYVLGRQLVELAPLTCLAPDQTLAFGLHELPLQVTYRLIADAHAMPDIDVLARATSSKALAELVAAG